MHDGMGKCFGTWARILTSCNRLVGFTFLLVYLAICKVFYTLILFLGTNLRFFEAFTRNRSQMQIWVPENNQVRDNEIISSNLWDDTFWDAYFK